MGKFIHIHIKPTKEVTKKQVETKLNLAVDWYRYDDNLYIVYTTANIDKWQTRLLELVETDGNLFICELQIENRNGWMNSAFWDWIRKNQTRSKKP